MKGYLRKRGERSWGIQLYLGSDLKTGEKQYKTQSFKGNKKQAEAELARLVHQVETGAYVLPARLTVGDYLRRWLTDYGESHVSGRTLERYKSIVVHHLIPGLGSIPLPKLQPLHVQALYSECLKEGGRRDGRKGSLSAQSVLHVHRVLSEALKMAVRWQLVARNVCDAVEPPTVRPREVQAIDETATAWLLDAALGTRLHVPIWLAVSCGLRRGEILALRWEDADFDTGILRVCRALEETKAGVRIKEPKGKRRRTLALAPLVVEVLQAHKQDQDRRREALGGDYQDQDLVCPRDDGSIWVPSAFTSAYRDLLRRRKLTGPNFHALRHSHASQMLKAGVDLKSVSARLGHAKSGFTLETYGHMLPGQDQEAARRIDVTLRAAIEKQRRPVA